MKIALIAPPYPLEEAPSPPLGLCYIAGVCEAAGVEVKIFDYIISKFSPEKLKNQLDIFKPDIVGSTCVTMNFFDAVKIIQLAKKYNPDIITIMGGPHVSFDYINILKSYPEVDIIVIGEGEKTIQELIYAVSNNKDIENVHSIAFKRNNKIITTEKQELISNLDEIPLPARHLLSLSRYQALGFPASIITSRGCPNNCIFCQGRRMVGKKLRFRNVDLILDEIETLLNSGMQMINIADDLFTANKKRVIEFCQKIKERNLSFIWSAFSRVNTVDLEILMAMKDAGCYAVSFGIESGNQDILKIIKKNITLDQARQATKWCKQSGIRTHASFMVGLPGESPETLLNTKKFADELEIEYGFHFLSPFPGTTIRENIDDYDLSILTNDWSLYDANKAIVKTSKIEPDQMDEFVSECHKEEQNEFELMKKKYLDNKNLCSDNEIWTVENHLRCHLMFNILTFDLIEDLGNSIKNLNDPINELSEKISNKLLINKIFVYNNLKRLVNEGFLQYKKNNDYVSFYWK